MSKMRDGVVKRGKNYYYVVREVDPQTGTKKPRWRKGTANHSETKALRAAAISAMHEGTYVPPRNLTVGEWLDQWIEAHEVELKPSSAQGYRDKIRLYLKPAVGHANIRDLSPTRLSLVWREMQLRGGANGRPLSRRTVEYARATLRKALEDAVVERIIPVNPVIGSKMAKRDGKPKHTTWTAEQLGQFLDACRADRWATLWRTLASTGMRRGEVAGLRWTAVNLEDGIIKVEVSMTQVRGQAPFPTTPKNHERRKVSIDAGLVQALRAWKASQSAERLRCGMASDENQDWVFTWPDGRPVQPDFLTKAFGKLQVAVAAGEPDLQLPQLTVHQLRHSHATILLRARVPVHIVAKRLGHKDPSVTLNTYADVIPDDDTSAVDVFRQAVFGA